MDTEWHLSSWRAGLSGSDKLFSMIEYTVTFFLNVFIYHSVAREIPYRMIYNIWGFFLIIRENVFIKVGTDQYFHKKAQEIMTFFAITQEDLDQSFSSSNSNEIFMRQFYVQNFITIEWPLRVIVYMAGQTRRPILVYSLFEYTKTTKRLGKNRKWPGVLLYFYFLYSKEWRIKNFFSYQNLFFNFVEVAHKKSSY